MRNAQLTQRSVIVDMIPVAVAIYFVVALVVSHLEPASQSTARRVTPSRLFKGSIIMYIDVLDILVHVSIYHYTSMYVPVYRRFGTYNAVR